MTHKEVLTLALETHSKNESHRTLAETRYWCDQYKLLAKTAIEALVQPEQEPVAIQYASRAERDLYEMEDEDDTTPPQRTWVGLTDREKSNLWLESRAAIPRFHTYATLVEAKLKEKNT